MIHEGLMDGVSENFHLLAMFLIATDNDMHFFLTKVLFKLVIRVHVCLFCAID